MFAGLRDFAQGLLGRGEATLAVPPFDGALKPNQILEQAETVVELEAPEDLASDGERLYLADGPRLMRVEGSGATLIRAFEAPISALACLTGGRLAVALKGGDLRVYAAPDAGAPDVAFSATGHGLNALAGDGAGALYATDGSSQRDPDEWVWDLMQRGRSGRLLRFDLATKQTTIIADKLHYAFGVAAMGERALVSESWSHRLVGVARDGAASIALPHLPVYPSRLTPAAGGGWWLTAFVARTQLVEFVLREPAFRKRMLAEIAPEHWIAPRLGASGSFKQPMQGAHLKTMGVVKPWAPPTSYGLVIRLDAAAQPRFSLHSRVDGVNHGVAAAAECGGYLYLVAKGPRRLLRQPLAGLTGEPSR
ncbi:MAG: hypothetical protein KGM15_08345 [Pseudomonadota bacterium]|nr:hypothetical protein [Pseudomonadota bacterium]